MMDLIRTGAVHHLSITVTDAERLRDFYTILLGFTVLTQRPSGRPAEREHLAGPWHGGQATDRLDENRVGLDHLSFTVSGLDALEAAERLLNERGIPNGGVKDLRFWTLHPGVP